MYSLTEEDKKWPADSDARTLAAAQVIAADDERMTAAKQAVEKLAEQLQNVEALDNVDKVFTKQKSTNLYPNTNKADK